MLYNILLGPDNYCGTHSLYGIGRSPTFSMLSQKDACNSLWLTLKYRLGVGSLKEVNTTLSHPPESCAKNRPEFVHLWPPPLKIDIFIGNRNCF